MTGTGNHSYRHRETMSCTGQKEESVTDGGVCPHTSGSVTYVVCWKQHEWCCNTSGCVISECGRVCVGTVSERGLTQTGQSHRWRTLTESRERERETEREKKGANTTKREKERDLVQRVQGTSRQHTWDGSVCVQYTWGAFLGLFDSLFLHKYTWEGSSCDTECVWATCVD